MRDCTFQDLTIPQQELLLAAENALTNAYKPYSTFSVASAVRGKNHRVYVGVNVENAAYSPCLCAERNAIGSAVTGGVEQFESIAVIARPKEGGTEKPTSPCGVCRQVIFEFSQVSGVDIEVIMSTTNMETITIATISELLPLAFGPADLGLLPVLSV